MSPPPPEMSGRTAAMLRWTLAGLLVVAAHAGAGWWVVTRTIAGAVPPDTVQGLTIDLEPIAVPQNAPLPSATMASGAAPAAPPVTPPEPVQPPEPPPPLPPPPVPPPIEEPAPAVMPATPPLPPPPVESKTDAVLAPPPKPRPPKPSLPRPDPRTAALEAARRRAVAERREAQREARAAARAQAAQRAPEAPAGGRSSQDAAPSSVSSGAAISTWRGEVVAHLNATKPASPNGASGTARVAFSVDRAGRVVSVGLAGSSGDAALDAAALAMVRRASPVPAPPPELGGQVSLAVPVHFH